MTDNEIMQTFAQYQSALDRKQEELAQLRQLRIMVQKFLKREASFAQLREAAKESANANPV